MVAQSREDRGVREVVDQLLDRCFQDVQVALSGLVPNVVWW